MTLNQIDNIKSSTSDMRFDVVSLTCTMKSVLITAVFNIGTGGAIPVVAPTPLIKYTFSCCEVCKERLLECKGTRNICTRGRREKKMPKVWSEENNMDPMSVPEILSGMLDAELMLIARLAPTVHVHMLRHGGIASKEHCIAFPPAVQEPATILPPASRGTNYTGKRARKG